MPRTGQHHQWPRPAPGRVAVIGPGFAGLAAAAALADALGRVRYGHAADAPSPS